MGDEKSGSSDVEVENADDDSVFSDPNQKSSELTLLNKTQENVPLKQPHHQPVIAKTMAVPTSFLVQQASPNSPHILINPSAINSNLNQVLITPGQLLQSAYPGHLPQTQLHPATQSRLDDAKSKNLLTVYCNSASDGKKILAVLDKTQFGSGNKGACIKYMDKMLTPRAFEIECQLEQSRDWRRSIHCQGETLKDLIKQGVLKPHAQSCVCDICIPGQKTGAAVKYEEEVTRRRAAQVDAKRRKLNSASMSQSASSKRVRKDFFFPSESNTPALHTPATPAKKFLHHPIFQSSLFTRFDSQDQGRIRSVVENFDNAQSQSLRRLQMLDENISQCERQLRLVKDVAAEERALSQDRENKFYHLLSCISDSVERSEARQASRIVTTSTYIPPPVYNPLDELKTPHSAPPESPVRNPPSHPDRRRTSSDTCMSRPQILNSQRCSNVPCDRIARWKCIGCEKAIYCGKECQEDHWSKGHEDECEADK